MRVVLSKIFQRQLIEQAKATGHLSWKEMANILGTAETTLRNEWRHAKITLPLDAFKKLSAMSDIQRPSDYIIELKNDTWGKRLGALSSNPKRALKINRPIRNEGLAELIGILLGDGNVFADEKHGVYSVRIFLNSKKEREYAKYISSLVSQVFGLETAIMKVKNRNCVFVAIQSKKLVEYLCTKEGFQSGSKISNQTTIPKWIWKNKDYLRACVRGLIDTDGSLYRLKPHWPNLFQLSFKNNNKTLLMDARNAFVRLGFHPSRLFGNRFVITRQKEIMEYLKEIGTHNNQPRRLAAKRSNSGKMRGFGALQSADLRR